MGMEIKKLNDEERRNCHQLFRNNDLFRHWHPILSEIERNFTEMDAISVWYNADVVLRHLRSVTEFRDEELNFIHSEISRNNTKEVVSTIMAVVLTRLINATEEEHEEEDMPNDLICNAILKNHLEDVFFDKMMNVFFKRNIGNDGKKVVITPSDPMTQNTLLDDMDDIAKKEINDYVNRVMEVTGGLKVYIKDWNEWENLWKSICLDIELLALLKDISPRGSEWGFNQKMVCNVIGMYVGAKSSDISITSINNALGTKNLRIYISNHCAHKSDSSPLSKEQHDKILKMIK